MSEEPDEFTYPDPFHGERLEIRELLKQTEGKDVMFRVRMPFEIEPLELFEWQKASYEAALKRLEKKLREDVYGNDSP